MSVAYPWPSSVHMAVFSYLTVHSYVPTHDSKHAPGQLARQLLTASYAARPGCTPPAGVLRTLLFYPLDLCRTRLTADTSPGGVPRPYTTIRGCLRDAWQKEGLLSWYKGLGLSLPGVVVYTSVSFTGYDWLKVRRGKGARRLLALPVVDTDCPGLHQWCWSHHSRREPSTDLFSRLKRKPCSSAD